MMFWVLVVLGAAPLVMAAIMIVILRTGAIHRLHERQRERERDGAKDEDWRTQEDSNL